MADLWSELAEYGTYVLRQTAVEFASEFARTQDEFDRMVDRFVQLADDWNRGMGRSLLDAYGVRTDAA